ncbi:C40 family peptidase [Paenibacillus thalictri]|uniref:Hydrolase Nlp/P60 n=1 Tax=Paenibacillus thalictri TaxID=2527873 RepID=A0A4Q9DK30_9BACL|nr:NlpC/P60 family protein [Paenibacillus thalictri]TBL75084.1 hydrolase Nlp/P60 [Paenibacillus thalictri]
MLRKMLTTVVICSAMTAGATALPFSQTVQAAAASTSLSQGMSGSQVTQLQTNLKLLQYFTYPNITGYFGSITAQAVKQLQKAYSLPETGEADAKTQDTIARALTKKSIVQDSYKYLKTPYVWGGVSPQTGFDCSGFIYYMFTTHGVAMQRTSSDQLFKMGSEVSRANLQTGDLVFFSISTPGVVDHVGIYVGGGQFISATRSMGIYVQSLDNNSYWTPRYLGAKRIY